MKSRQDTWIGQRIAEIRRHLAAVREACDDIEAELATGEDEEFSLNNIGQAACAFADANINISEAVESMRAYCAGWDEGREEMELFRAQVAAAGIGAAALPETVAYP